MDQLAVLSGVSKSMIARIESGSSTPTVTTLWKICNGLKVSFSTLLDDVTELDVVVNKETLKAATVNNTHELYGIIPFDVNKKFELFQMVVHPRSEHSATQHIGVSEEVIFIQEGELTIIVEDRERKLAKGDVYRFKPEVNHKYKNEQSMPVTLMVTIIYK
jgi:transcriptional regulator with XRE-family HTH domain